MMVQFTSGQVVIMFIILIILIHNLLIKIIDMIKHLAMTNMYKKLAKLGQLSANDVRILTGVNDLKEDNKDE